MHVRKQRWPGIWSIVKEKVVEVEAKEGDGGQNTQNLCAKGITAVAIGLEKVSFHSNPKDAVAAQGYILR